MLLVKLIIVILLLVIVGSLFSALFFLVKDDSDGKRTVKALTWRIGLSIAAILIIVIAGLAGLIPVKQMPF
jgi:small-conductance mechanosensitive channel